MDVEEVVSVGVVVYVVVVIMVFDDEGSVGVVGIEEDVVVGKEAHGGQTP